MRDIYAEVTSRIVAAVEAGTRPWAKPWNSTGAAVSFRPLRANGQAYRGVNTVVLWGAAMARGFVSPYWLTFNQAKELGASVKKGAKSEPVVYWGKVEKKDGEQPTSGDQGGDAGGDDKKRVRSFMRYYNVFNADEVEGLPASWYGKPEPTGTEFERHERAERTIAATGASIRHGGDRAFYSPAFDAITMPPREAFKAPAFYYGTCFHELVHWTGGSEKRTPRPILNRFGSEAYAVEELVAELGAAFLCADHGIETSEREDHAPYIASWLKALKADSRAIFTAAAAAEKAAGFVMAAAGDAEEMPEAA